jgi:hypothetical protein
MHPLRITIFAPNRSERAADDKHPC